MDGPETLPLGTVVGARYRLDRLLGSGGFGAVFAAADTRGGAPVALKVFDGHALAQIGGAARFEREAELARRLEHPGIVRVLDTGEDPSSGRRFIAFELLEGRSLEEELGTWGAMPAERVAEIALQVLSALEVAHDRGVVHRDLKPANLYLIDHGRQVKVLDFGIAKSTNPETAAGLTRDGLALGTPAYMALEQMTGAAVGPPADLFALGVVLVELLLGEPLYPLDTPPMQIARERITGKRLPIPEAVADHPLGQVIARATELDAQARYGCADDMAEDIRAAMGVSGFVDAIVSGPRRGAAPSKPNAAAMAPTAAAASQPAAPSKPHAVAMAPTAAAASHPGAAPLAPTALGPSHPAPSTPSAPGASSWPSHSAPAAENALSHPPPGAVRLEPLPPRPGSNKAMWALVLVVSALFVLGGIAGMLYYLYASSRQAATEARERRTTPANEPRRSREPMVAEPSETLSRQRECPAAHAMTRTQVIAHLQAEGWTVGPESQICSGSVVNDICMTTWMRGYDLERRGKEGRFLIAYCDTRDEARSFVREHGLETGRTLAPVRTSVLWIDMPDEAADALLDRMCE